MELPGWAVVVGSFGGAAGLVTAMATALKYRRDARREDTAGEAALQSSYRQLYEAAIADTARLQSSVRELEAREDDCADKLAAASAEIASLRADLDEIRRYLPHTLLAGRLSRYADLASLFDMASDAWVISSPQDDGKLLLVNRRFAALLGRSQADIIELGWRSLVRPEQLTRTSAAESAAWISRGGVRRHVAEYQHADGHFVALEWHYVAYEGGVTLSLVRDVASSFEGD